MTGPARASRGADDPVEVDDALLRAWPLPQPDAAGDKEERGRTLVVAGSRELVGAAALAGTASLRAGAGRLTIATARSVAPMLALAVPEARVIGLPETPAGGLDARGADALRDVIAKTDAVLIGPGLQDEDAACSFVAALASQVAGAAMVLDALALNALGRGTRFEQPPLITPHAGEMAHLCGASKEDIERAPAAAARGAAARWNAIVALKGARTHVATPDGGLWHHEQGLAGLATSGSGDVLAGLVTGLAARGTPLVQACVWGVALHARAGARLADEIGPLGFLARELAACVPGLLSELARGAPR
ncbi:MAG TPA: NAD(P)H-hydrate dehydratase [Caldimonas sp.]|nr:NAD(P)H-hydrate dehydratase [Caldimonas sp.]